METISTATAAFLSVYLVVPSFFFLPLEGFSLMATGTRWWRSRDASLCFLSVLGCFQANFCPVFGPRVKGEGSGRVGGAHFQHTALAFGGRQKLDRR